MGIGTLLTGGLLDFFTANETNKANRANTNAIIGAQGANQDKAIAALGGSDAFKTTTQNAAGGFDVTQPGGADAATARSKLAFGDVGRAQNINDATSNFNFTLPTKADAQGVIERDTALQQGTFDKGLGDLISANLRKFGGVGNTNENPNTIDAISRFVDANRFGGERDALDLFNKSGEADLGRLMKQIQANTPQAGAPAFTSGGPGGTAANVIAQSPPPASSPDLSGALPFAAGGNVVKQLAEEANSEEANKRFLAALRLLGNQPAKVTGV